MHVHWVFVTKYRRKLFDSAAIECLLAVFSTMCHDFGARLTEMNCEDDHVHPIVEYPPKVAVRNLVNSLKGVSSRLLRRRRPDIQKRYWKGVLWSPSWFASSCGGAPVDVVRRYIEQQKPQPEKQGQLRPPRYPSPPEGRGLPRNGSTCHMPSGYLFLLASTAIKTTEGQHHGE